MGPQEAPGNPFAFQLMDILDAGSLVGMDFRLKCLGCAHQVMIPRKQLEKSIKKLVSKADNNEK